MNTNLAYDMFGMTLDEYFAFVEEKPEFEHWELIDGIPFCFAGPSIVHQKICSGIFGQFLKYFDNTVCTPLFAPVDVVLFEDDDKHGDFVCQPDLLVYCDERQNDGKRIHGAPALVVEIWSESNDSNYRTGRIKMFREAGVKEIWEVDIESNTIKVTSLSDSGYESKECNFRSVAASTLFPGLKVELSAFDSNSGG